MASDTAARLSMVPHEGPGLDLLSAFLAREIEVAFAVADSPLGKNQKTTIRNLDPDNFPIKLPASVSHTFPLGAQAISVQEGAELAIDLFTGDKKADFLRGLELDKNTVPNLLSFSVKASLQGGPGASAGDFAFGLTAAQDFTASFYCPVSDDDTFHDAVTKTIQAFRVPENPADLRSLPPQHFCRIKGSSTLVLSASVQYTFLNNPLATLPLDVLSQSLNLNAQASAEFDVSIEHDAVHQLTFAARDGGKLRVAASIGKVLDVNETFSLSIGATATVAGQDALEFLIGQISKTPKRDIDAIKNALPPAERSDLAGQIRDTLAAATSNKMMASVQAAFDQSRELDHLFVYDVDFSAIDKEGEVALGSALRGDFTRLTSAAALSGIKAVDAFSSLTLGKTRTLTLHLLGILNCADVSSFIKSCKIGVHGETGDVVFAASETKVIENNVDSDRLREAFLRSAMITVSAASSPQNPDFAFKMVFFLRKPGPSASDRQMFSNVAREIGAPDPGQCDSVYLSLDMDKQHSLSVFANHRYEDFVAAGQRAMAAILAGDKANENRRLLALQPIDFWKELNSKGDFQDVTSLLKERGITAPGASVDFFSIDWWATAMDKASTALAQHKPLADAQADALKKSQLGFDIPWALLATWRLAGAPAIESKFALTPPAQRRTLAASH